MKAWVFFFSLIVAGILIAAALEDRGAEINEQRKTEAGAATTANANVDPEEATIEALQTQVAALANGETDPIYTTEPTASPTVAAEISTPTPTATSREADTAGDVATTGCPYTNAEWLGMAATALGKNGGFRENVVHNDDHDLILIKIIVRWTVPTGWDSNLTGQEVLEPGFYSLYPPLLCQGNIAP